MDKKRVLSIAASAVLAGSIFTGCSWNDDDETTTTASGTTTVAGTAIDGYLSGSTVCVDMDDNGVCDDGTIDVVSTTGTDGTFSFTTTKNVSGHKVLVYGGTDTATGADFVGVLKSTPSSDASSVVTPLTTLVTEVGSEAKVKAMLGITGTESLAKYDYVKAINASSGDTVAQSALSAAMKVQSIIATSVNAMGGTTADDKAKVASAVAKSIAASITASYTASSTTALDLTDNTKLAAIFTDINVSGITGAAAVTGANLTNIQNSLVQLNTLINTNAATGNIANVTAAVKVASDATLVTAMKTTALTSGTATTALNTAAQTLGNTSGVFTKLKLANNNVITVGKDSYAKSVTLLADGTFSTNIANPTGFDITNYYNVAMTIDNTNSTFEGLSETGRTLKFKISNGAKSIEVEVNGVTISDNNNTKTVEVIIPAHSTVSATGTGVTFTDLSGTTNSLLDLTTSQGATSTLSLNLETIKSVFSNQTAWNNAIAQLNAFGANSLGKTYTIEIGINSNKFVFANSKGVNGLGTGFVGYKGTLTVGDAATVSGVAAVNTNLQTIQSAYTIFETALTDISGAATSTGVTTALTTATDAIARATTAANAIKSSVAYATESQIAAATTELTSLANAQTSLTAAATAKKIALASTGLSSLSLNVSGSTINLPSTLNTVTGITWTSGTTATVSNDGVITRPSTGSVQVTLTAKLGTAIVGTKTVTIEAAPFVDSYSAYSHEVFGVGGASLIKTIDSTYSLKVFSATVNKTTDTASTSGFTAPYGGTVNSTSYVNIKPSIDYDGTKIVFKVVNSTGTVYATSSEITVASGGQTSGAFSLEY